MSDAPTSGPDDPQPEPTPFALPDPQAAPPAPGGWPAPGTSAPGGWPAPGTPAPGTPLPAWAPQQSRPPGRRRVHLIWLAVVVVSAIASGAIGFAIGENSTRINAAIKSVGAAAAA